MIKVVGLVGWAGSGMYAVSHLSFAVRQCPDADDLGECPGYRMGILGSITLKQGPETTFNFACLCLHCLLILLLLRIVRIIA